MKNIIEFSVKHPIPIFMALLALLILGIISCFTMNVDFLPILESRKLLVSTEYDGISAQEIKNLVTVPLENAFASLSGLKKITSVSRDGISLITVEFHWGIDVDLSLVETREIIDSIYETLPARCKKPNVIKLESLNESISIAMIPLDNDLKYGRYIAENDIKSRLQRLNGIANVNIVGGEKEIIEVRVNQNKLNLLKITLQDVAQAIAESNFEYPSGKIIEGEKIISVKTSGLYKNYTEILDTPIILNNNYIKVSDIADVVNTIDEKETVSLYNGKECINISIKKKRDASPLLISKNIKNEIKELTNIYGKYFKFEVINDLSREVKSSVNSLLISGTISCIITAIVIFIFFRSIKTSLILFLVIPICVLISCFILNICGKSLNIISLSGLAIGLGMVVDCSSVVIENIQKNISKNKLSETNLIIAVNEVVLSNVGSTLTTVVVFVPVFFIKGLMGELFIDMAISVISSIVISCVLSFTFIPSVFSLTLKTNNKSNHLPFDNYEKRYSNILYLLDKKRYICICIVASILLIGFISVRFTKFELLPSLNSKSINVQISLPIGTTLESMQDIAFELHNKINNIENIKSINISCGISPDDFESLSLPETNQEIIYFDILTDGREKTKRNIFSIFENLRYIVTFNNKTDILSDIIKMDENMYVMFEDESLGFYNINNLVESEKYIIPNVVTSEYTFLPDRLGNARFSVSALYTSSIAYNFLEGIEASSIYKNGIDIPIYVKAHDTENLSIKDLENIFVNIENESVPLKLLGSIEMQEKEKVLYRYNRKDAKLLVNPIDLTNLLSLQDEQLKEMVGDGIILVFVVILLLYLVMGAQFESFSIPILLMIILPPAFSGAFLFLLICNQSLNINSIIALVVLFGTSVNNTILLYESCINCTFITKESVIKSCVEKFRALLITNLTTICALLPLSIDPFNINSQTSLSIAIIGGLLFSLIIVLFIVPILFSIVLPKRNIQDE